MTPGAQLRQITDSLDSIQCFVQFRLIDTPARVVAIVAASEADRLIAAAELRRGGFEVCERKDWREGG